MRPGGLPGRDPGLELFGPDGFHPTELGSYLAALVIYQQLTDVAARRSRDIFRLAGRASKPDCKPVKHSRESAAEANGHFARP